MNGTKRRHESQLLTPTADAEAAAPLLPFATKTKSHFWPSPATLNGGPSFPLLWPFHRNLLKSSSSSHFTKLMHYYLLSSVAHPVGHLTPTTNTTLTERGLYTPSWPCCTLPKCGSLYSPKIQEIISLSSTTSESFITLFTTSST